jgi:hypothetical protein
MTGIVGCAVYFLFAMSTLEQVCKRFIRLDILAAVLNRPSRDSMF